MAWTDEKKAAVVKAYKSAEPTPETSIEIVKELADEFDESPNGVRMILTKAEVYVKKADAAKTAAEGKAAGGGRVSKAGAQDALTAILEAQNLEVDLDIISKLTGKAAQYFAKIIGGETEED
jgi:hypothetical protein